MKLIKVCCIALTALFVNIVEAEIYKWIDDSGITHYTQTPPPKHDSETIDIPSDKTTGSSRTGKISGGFSKTVSGVTKTLKNGVNNTTILNCEKAVEYSLQSIENMLEVGKKKTESGHVNQEDYIRISNNLEKVKRKLSVSECESSKGSTKEFYRCMSDDLNNIANCGKKHSIMDSE